MLWEMLFHSLSYFSKEIGETFFPNYLERNGLPTIVKEIKECLKCWI